MTGTWKDLGMEWAGRAVPAGLGEAGSSWPLDREWLKQVSIRWPSQYAWPDAHKWLDPLRHGLQRFVRVSPAILPQPFEHIILIELAGAALPRTVAIDYADRKSTRLNSSHVRISYAVFCLKKKTNTSTALDGR